MQVDSIIINVIVYCFAVIVTVFLNLALWKTIYVRDTTFNQRFAIIYISTLLIFLSLCYWGFITDFPHIYIILFMLTYINLCFFYKKICNSIQYFVIFNLFSVFFVLWITVLFGKYYYDNQLIDVSTYQNHINSIIDKYPDYLFPIMDLHASTVFFSIGLKEYFTSPNEISLSDIHFIQHIVRWLIPCIFGAEIAIVAPNFKNEHTKPKPTKDTKTESADLFEIFDYTTYSVGIRKVDTYKIYKELNTHFGVKFKIKNTSIQTQQLDITITICDSNGINGFTWSEKREMEADTTIPFDVIIPPEVFEKMKEDMYEILFTINENQYNAHFNIECK